MTLSVNADVYAEFKRRNTLLGLNISGLVEDMMIQVLNATEPMKDLLPDDSISERQAIVSTLQVLASSGDIATRGSTELHNLLRTVAHDISQKGKDTGK